MKKPISIELNKQRLTLQETPNGQVEIVVARTIGKEPNLQREELITTIPADQRSKVSEILSPMKIETKLLAVALKNLARIFSRKVQAPVSGCVLINAVDGTMTLSASDLIQWQEEEVPCREDFGPLCVNFAHLSSSLSDAEFSDLSWDDNFMTVKSGHRVMKLSTMDAGEFPVMPEDKMKMVPVPRERLAAALDAVAGFEHPQEERGILHGIHVECNKSKLIVEACDGRNAAHHSQKLGPITFSVVLADGESARCLSDCLKREGATLKFSEKAIAVKHDAGLYRMSLINGVYPSTDKFLTAKYSDVGEVLAAAFIQEMESCLLLRDPQITPAVDIKFSAHAADIAFVGSNNAQIKSRVAGKFSPAEIRVNGEAFLKCLKAMPEKFKIQHGDDKVIMDAGDLKVVNAQLRS